MVRAYAESTDTCQRAPITRRRLLVVGAGLFLSLAGVGRAAVGGETLLKRFAIAPFVVPRTRRPTRFRVGIGRIRRRLRQVAASPDEAAVLRFGGVSVARPPGAIWRVYLAPPGVAAGALQPFFVGNVALFGAGVGDAPPTTLEFRVDQAVLRSLRTAGDVLELVFVPSGPLSEGSQTAPVPKAALKIARLSLWARRA